MIRSASRRFRSRGAADALWALALLALPWLLYRGALDLWWTEDDFFQLRYALGYGPADYGLDPEVWRRLPNRVLSPLLFVSYDLDLALFGLDSAAFYAHQIASITLAAAALYALLRLWLSPLWAGAGGLLFLLGPPTASLASHLMVRHYPEAVALGLAAAACWVLAVRSPGRGKSLALTLASALLYLAASSAKEIAVPLPFLLVLVPEGTWKRRLRLLLPHAFALAVYSVYRIWMLGTPLGGYGFAVTVADWPRLAAGLPVKIGRELAGGTPAGWLLLSGALVLLALLALSSRRAAILLVAGAALALLPVLPVSTAMAPRYAVAAWLALAAALPFGVRALVLGLGNTQPAAGRRRLLGLLVLALVLGAGLAANRSAWAYHHARAERMRAETRGFLELGPGELLRHPLGPPASMEELRRFAREVLGRPAPGGWFYDDLYLCQQGMTELADQTVHGYDPATGRLVDLSVELPALAREHCAGIRRQAPLEVVLRHQGDGVLAWELGPYADAPGSGYAFVLDHGRLRYEVPREAAFHLGALPEIALRVRYDSAQGWVTYSPELRLDLAPGAKVRWRR